MNEHEINWSTTSWTDGYEGKVVAMRRGGNAPNKVIIFSKENTFITWLEQRGNWTERQPLPEGLTLDEQKAYTLTMYRLSN